MPFFSKVILGHNHLREFMDSKGYATDRYGREAKPGYYPYISCTAYDYLVDIFSRFARPKDNFVDVGCGIGDKLFLAAISYDKWNSINGIEVNPETYYVAKYLSYVNRLEQYNLSGGVNIIKKDALRVDYSVYSFIYMYHPIHDPKIYKKLVDQIKLTSKDNTVLVEMLHRRSSNLGDDLEDEIIAPVGKDDSNNVFIKENGVFKPVKDWRYSK